MDCFSRRCGLTRRVEDFSYNEVGLEGGWAFGLQSIQNDRSQVRDRVVERSWDWLGGDQLFIVFFGEAQSKIVALDGDYVAGFAVDFHVFAVERPVPRRLKDRLGLGISDDDGGLVVYARIGARLEMLGHCGDRIGTTSVHKPSHQVGAVAAEIE